MEDMYFQNNAVTLDVLRESSEEVALSHITVTSAGRQ